jgi:hypothetical protein
MLCNLRALQVNFVYAVATALFLFGTSAMSVVEAKGDSRPQAAAVKNPVAVNQATGDASESKAQTKLASIPKDASVKLPSTRDFDLLSREPFDLLQLENIKPLYTDPKMEGEGVWESATSPRDSRGLPIVYRTFYRPSVEFPNAIVYMMVVNMKKAEMRYYVGTQEPAAPVAQSKIPDSMEPRILAITNAMWQQRHSRGAGAVFRGKILYPMVNGMATLIAYKDGSVDIRNWGSDIPLRLVRDARQLRYLIVNNGMVVQKVLKRGKIEDAEIGLGFLLGKGEKNVQGKRFWYIAHRSAFGIRKDGNLVFAIGHHIGTRDLAKCLALAGCVRGIHGDANPANIVGNLYLRDGAGNLLRRSRLSPEQSKYSVVRYDREYTKDFFGFFHRGPSYAPAFAERENRAPRRAKR